MVIPASSAARSTVVPSGTSISLSLIVNWTLIYFSFLMNHYGIKVTHLHTDATADTFIRVDDMPMAALPTDSLGGAVAGANHTTGAGIRDNFIRDQALTNLSRAAFLVNM